MMIRSAPIRLSMLTIMLGLLVGCDSGTSSSNENANETPEDTEQETASLPEPKWLRVYSGDLCPIEGARVLVNNDQGALVGERTTDQEGRLDLNDLPEEGSLGVVRRLTLSTFSGTRTLTAIQHYDVAVLGDASSIHFAGAESECEEDSSTAPGTITVTIENAAEFTGYRYSTGNNNDSQSDSPLTIGLEGDQAVIIGNVSSGDRRYALIDTTNLEAGDEIEISLDKTMRAIDVTANADVNPGTVSSYWFSESGQRFRLESGGSFDPLMTIDTLDEPGRVAIYSQSIQDPSRVDESVFGDAQTATELAFEARNSDLQNVMLADKRFYYWSSIDQAGFTLGQIDYGNVVHGYMAQGTPQPLVMPDVPSDLLVAGDEVEGQDLLIYTLDPLENSTRMTAAELRVNGKRSSGIGPVDFTEDRSAVYSARW
jgi:hypothetical protein